MLDTESKRRKEQQKQKVKKRYNVTIDPENYMFIPAKKQTDYYDNDVNQRVAIYVRVSTDDVRQTTSYELQKKYYEEFVTRHPNWTLVKIYADEGISGTSLKKRDEFNRMIADCRAGKIDMIITKSVSRFARNVDQSRNAISEVSEGARGTVAATSIKDMPAFDPDADINGLALTIPSWSSSIDRVLKQTDLSIISSHAREGLVRQLLSLTDHVSDLLGAIKED